ncbi:MAG TPA: Rho termination factor N-terminal domain-containing protein [Methylophilaceae bacterium]|nr:Rho termination factor N-terminal domain-containing protein [Methylophilaceae bacterium]
MASHQQQGLQSKTRDELYQMAREQHVSGSSDMSKEELIRALGGSQKSGSSQREDSHSRDTHQASGRSESHSRGSSSAPGHGGGQGDTPPPRGAKPQDYKNIPGNQS